MDREGRKLKDNILKIFEDKGYKKEEIEEIGKVKKNKLYNVEKISDLKEMINKSVEKFKDEVAFKYKEGPEKQIKEVTYSKYLEDVNALGTQLISMGLKNTKVAVISENRYEWALTYLAVVCGVGVIVPLDKSLPANELESLIVRSGVETIFYSQKYDETMKDIKERNTTNIRYYISMDSEKWEDGIYSQSELISMGKKSLEEGNRKYLDAEINNEEMSIMLFTSGTTAMSKAVMLSHKNICSNIMDIGSVIHIDEKDTLLSFLPLHHTFECTVGFLYPLYRGAKIAYCEGVKHILQNLAEFEITAMISVPAIIETMYRRLMKNIEKQGKKQEVETMMKLVGALSRVKLDFRRKVFKDIHQALGGKLRIIVNGAATLDKEVEKGFNALGFRVMQGYGLTETSPVLAAGNDFEQKIGSVGKVFPSVKIKIVNKDENGIGEIYAKGPNVMLGYYQNEEATKEVFDKEWFKTGDLGYFDKKGFLFLCGRAKSVIVLKNGKNIFPEELETIINRIDGITESFVYGKPEDNNEDDLKICAKIVYDKDLVKNVYGIAEKEEIYNLFLRKIKEINKTMPPYKYIKEIIITEEELIKTTTQKIKRHEEMKKIANS